MLSLCFWVTLLFAILYAMASMDVTGQCYCDPCTSSSPAITSGLSIVTAMGAFLFIAQVRFCLFPCWACLVLCAGRIGDCEHFLFSDVFHDVYAHEQPRSSCKYLGSGTAAAVRVESL